MSGLNEAGQRAAEQVGIVWRPVPQDGTWHETPAEGKGRRNGAGRVKLFPDGEGGQVWNWLTGDTLTFWARNEATLDHAEKEARRKRAEEMRRQTEAEREQAAAECRKQAAEIWKAAGPAPADHPYLHRKGIKPNGARIHDGRLLVSVWGPDGTLHGLQFIDADGGKRFLTGTAKASHYSSIGGKPDGVLYLAEGFATAATIREATGGAVAVAFDCGNLRAVAVSLAAKYTDARLIVCGDNDYGTEGNPGRTAAIEAARAVGGFFVVPQIPEGATGTDFNDLASVAGLDEVRRQIETAQPVQSIPEAKEAEEKATQGEDGRRSPYQLATSTADLRLLDIRTEYLVEGLIPKGMISLFYAPSGMGKSTLANQLCQAVQDGTPFLGLPTIKTPVFYLDFENPLPTIVERLRKIGGVEPFPLWHHSSEVAPPQIDREKDRQCLFDIVEGTLLVIDTLKASNDADENKATDMKPVFDFLKALRRYGLTVLVLHHTSKGPDGTYRGSTVIQDQSDHCLSLVKVKAPGSEQEADDDDDAQTYRFGTRGKTRAKPFRMYLSFDVEKELFILAEDPAQEMMKTIRFAMECITKRGEVVNQKRIIEELKEDGVNDLAKGKIISLLRRGTGTFWTTEKGLHNATLYTPISVFQFSSPYKGQETGKLISDTNDPTQKNQQPADNRQQQTGLNTEFASFPQLSNEGEKLTEPATADGLPDFDV